MSSGRCSSCHGRGVWIAGPGARDPEGRIFRCPSCKGNGICEACRGTGGKFERRINYDGLVAVMANERVAGSCGECDRNDPPVVTGQDEVVFRGFYDGGELGVADRCEVRRVRAGDRYGLVIESAYNIGGSCRVLLPVQYRTLTVKGRMTDEFEVEVDGQVLVINVEGCVCVREVRDLQPKPSPVPAEQPPPSPPQVKPIPRPVTATRLPRPAPPRPKETKCKCCGQPRSEGKPECPNCGFTDWSVLVVALVFAVLCATVLAFRIGWWTWVACGLGGLAIYGAIWCVWLNVRAIRRKSRDG